MGSTPWPEDRPTNEGGDDACWLERVCDRCGGFLEDPATHVCRTPADPPDADQQAGDRRRDLVALSDRGHVLTVVGESADAALPTVAAWPTWADLAAACGVTSLRRVAPALRATAEGDVVHVVASDEVSALEGAWTPLGDLDGRGLPPGLADAISSAHAAFEGRVPLPDRRPPWFRDGWLAVVDEWIDRALARLGWRRTGPSQPTRLWSLSAVLSVPVTGDGHASAVWFKASFDWFRAEPAITGVIGSFAPDLVPRLIDADVERTWMLMEPLPSGAEPDPGRVAASIADLQLRSIRHLDGLRAAGCPDRTLGPTGQAFHDLVRTSRELALLSDNERRAALEAEAAVAAGLEALGDCGVPDTLVHGDLHLGNVAADERRVVLFDWTDGCISNPFLDGPRLARSVRPEDRDAVRDGYLAPWRAAYPACDLERAWDLAARIGDPVFQAISYEGIYAAQEEASRWEMAGVVAQALRDLGAAHPSP